MASNLNEYYKSQGQALPSVAERQGVATQAGISNYSGTAEQNGALLGYLKSTPTQKSTVITADALTPEKAITVKQPAPVDTTTNDNAIKSLAETAKIVPLTDQQKYTATETDITKLLEAGDTTAANELIYKQQGVDTKRKSVDTITSQIEQEQKATLDKVTALEKEAGGLTGGNANAIAKVKSESASRLANYGIALSAVSRDYEASYNIASRQIQQNADARKAQIEAKQFVLQQLGTKLATEKANAFTLELRAIDQETKLVDSAMKYITDGMADGSIDQAAGTKALQQLTSGKANLSQVYNSVGNNKEGIVAGVDISSYATDPLHEQRVISIYNTIGNISNSADAQAAIKALAPNSKITGDMVYTAASKYGVDPKLLISMMQQDSSLGTKGLGAKNNNPGNIGQFDELGTNGVKGYKTLGEGVEAVAKWLSNHKATGRYNGEFAGTLETIAYATNEPDKTKKANLQNLQKYIGDGDYKTAYKQIENTVSKVLTGENKTQFDAKRIALPAVQDLEAKLKAYEAGGGKMGLLKGNYEKIYNKLGEVKDPKYAALAADLRISLQKYRKDMSGAAFSAQEAADYASVNPAGTNSLELNLSIINGMKDNFQRQIENTVDTYAGDGARYIREYATAGTTPTTNNKSTVLTPTGNSFTINQ